MERKRSLPAADPGSPSGPPKKKHADSGGSEPTFEQKPVEILQVHNRAMLIRIEELKSEIHVLSSRIRSFETRQESHDDELSSVHRVWTRLQEDLRLVLARLGTEHDALQQGGSSHGLLGQLLEYQQQQQTLLAAADQHGSAVQHSILQRRTDETHRVLTSIVAAIESERARSAGLFERLREADGQQQQQDERWRMLLDENERLRQENSRLTTTNDQLIIRHKDMSDQLSATEQQRARLQHHIEDIREQMLQLRDALEDTTRRSTKEQLKLKDEISRLRDHHANGVSSGSGSGSGGMDGGGGAGSPSVGRLQLASSAGAGLQYPPPPASAAAGGGGGGGADYLANGGGAFAAAAAASSPPDARLQRLEDELHSKEALLTSRAELIARLQEERNALALDYERLRATIGNPSPDVVQRHRLYVSLQQQAQHFESEQKLARAALDKLQSQYDTAVKDWRAEVDKAQAAYQRLKEQAERDAKDFEAKLSAVRAERDQILRQQEIQKTVANSPQVLLAELRTTLASREADVKRLKDLQGRHKAETEQYKQQLADARRALQQAELQQQQQQQQLQRSGGGGSGSELEKLKRKADDDEKQLELLKKQRQSWKDRERELSSTIEALEATHKEKRDIRDIRISERKLLDECADLQARFTIEKEKRVKLQAQLQQLEARGGGSDGPRSAAAAASGSNSSNSDSSSSDSDQRRCLELERTVHELRSEIESRDREIESLRAEFENISSSFEELQDQKDRIMQQLSDREDAFQKLMTEQIKSSQAHNLLKKEKDAAVERMRTLDDKYMRLDDLMQKMDNKLKLTSEQARKYADDLRMSSALTDGYKRQWRDAQAFAADYKLQMERLEKELDEMRKRCEDKVRSYEAELVRNDRLEEQMSMLKRKLEKQQSKIETPPEKVDILLQEEVKSLRRQVTCFVCNDRPKDSVITRCFHMFCRQCLQRNLEIRHRKCPACSEPFGQNDVHAVYFS